MRNPLKDVSDSDQGHLLRLIGISALLLLGIAGFCRLIAAGCSWWSALGGQM